MFSGATLPPEEERNERSETGQGAYHQRAR